MWVGPLDDPTHCLLIVISPCSKNIVGLGIHILMAGNIQDITINLDFWILGWLKAESTYIP